MCMRGKIEVVCVCVRFGCFGFFLMYLCLNICTTTGQLGRWKPHVAQEGEMQSCIPQAE